MGTFLYTVLVALAGVAAGVGISIPFWRRQLWKLDLIWRMQAAHVVNTSIANFFGGRVENGVIYLPGHGPEDLEAGEPDGSKKPN